MSLRERTEISDSAQAVLDFLAPYTTVEGYTFVTASTISSGTGVEIEEVEGLFAELVEAGELAHLTRRGDGFRLQVVGKAGLG